MPTVLINCAGIVQGKPMLQMNNDEVLQFVPPVFHPFLIDQAKIHDRSYRTNTIAQYRLNQLFIEPLKSHPNGGTIVTVSSVLAKLGAAQLSVYSATKAALLAYHASLTAELATDYPQIKTILVMPGQLSTDLFSGIKQTPMQRFFGPVVEVTDLAVKMVKMISDGQGGSIVEPAYARWISAMDLLPAGVQKMVRKLAGVDTAMATFRDR